jgi:hypothetical protein
MKIEVFFRLHIDGCEPMDLDYESAKKLFKELKSVFEPSIMTKSNEELLKVLEAFKRIDRNTDIPYINPGNTGPIDPNAQPVMPPYNPPWPGYPKPYIGDFPLGITPSTTGIASGPAPDYTIGESHGAGHSCPNSDSRFSANMMNPDIPRIYTGDISRYQDGRVDREEYREPKDE